MIKTSTKPTKLTQKEKEATFTVAFGNTEKILKKLSSSQLTKGERIIYTAGLLKQFTPQQIPENIFISDKQALVFATAHRNDLHQPLSELFIQGFDKEKHHQLSDVNTILTNHKDNLDGTAQKLVSYKDKILSGKINLSDLQQFDKLPSLSSKTKQADDFDVIHAHHEKNNIGTEEDDFLVIEKSDIKM